MKVSELESVMDEWTNLRVERYDEDTDGYVVGYDSYGDPNPVSVPDNVGKWEVTKLSFDSRCNSLVAYCDYVEEDDDED